jgi:multisubunit Na+/H+ antiporter MnhE subunit
MRVLQHFIIGIPIAILWVILTNQLGFVSLGLGYVVGVILSYVLSQGKTTRFRVGNLPLQVVSLVIYLVILARDIVLSGIDVALRVLGIRPLRTGIIAVDVHDDNQVVAGLSAHAITITPGEMVVDFNTEDSVMYVHSLDVEQSAPTLDKNQQERARILRRILGRD